MTPTRNTDGVEPCATDEAAAVLIEYDDRGGVRTCRLGESDWGVVSAPGEGSAAAALERSLATLAGRTPEAWIMWRRVATIETNERPSAPPVPLPSERFEIVHAGLAGPQVAAVRSIGMVDLDDAWLAQPVEEPSDRERLDWLLSPEAGVLHASLLEAVPFRDCGDLLGSWLSLGRRASRAGWLCLVKPAASRMRSEVPLALPRHPDRLAPMIEQCYGSRWVAFWRLLRVFVGPERMRAGFRLFWSGGLLRASSPDHPALQDDVGEGSDEPPVASISVVMPTMGRPAALHNVLLDLDQQTLPPSEAVVVEQRPPDFELAAVEALPEVSFDCPIERVSWIGAGRARNLAITHTTGEWLLFLDDDVGIAPDGLERLLETATRNRVDAVCAGVISLNGEQRERLERSGFDRCDHTQLVKELIAPASDTPRKRVRMHNSFAGCAALVRREAVLSLNGFDERLDLGYGEDFDLGVRLRHAGWKVVESPSDHVLHLHAPLGGFRALNVVDWEGDDPRPSPVLLQSRTCLTKEMQCAFVAVYVLRCLVDTGWNPLRQLQALRRLRAAFRWRRRVADRPRGGLAQESRSSEFSGKSESPP